MRRFDLMIPGDPHKESWSNGQMAVREFYAPLSVAGSVYASRLSARCSGR